MPKKKLTELDIRAIFYFKQHGYTGPEIAKLFKVTKSHISRVLNKNRWNKFLVELFAKPSIESEE